MFKTVYNSGITTPFPKIPTFSFLREKVPAPTKPLTEILLVMFKLSVPTNTSASY